MCLCMAEGRFRAVLLRLPKLVKNPLKLPYLAFFSPPTVCSGPGLGLSDLGVHELLPHAPLGLGFGKHRRRTAGAKASRFGLGENFFASDAFGVRVRV